MTEYSLASVEREAIIRALVHCKGVKEHAYKLLQIGRSTLYRKIHEHGIEPHEYMEKETPEP